MTEKFPFPEGVPVGPAIYTSAELVLKTNKIKYDAFRGQGYSPEEAIKLTFQKQLESPRTSPQDIEFIKEAIEKGYKE